MTKDLSQSLHPQIEIHNQLYKSVQHHYRVFRDSFNSKLRYLFSLGCNAIRDWKHQQRYLIKPKVQI